MWELPVQYISLSRPLPRANGLRHENFASSENKQEKKAVRVSYHVAYATLAQWRAEEGRTGWRPRASKVGGHPKSEITKIKML